MSGVVVFDYVGFIELYPQFANITEEQTLYFFAQAEAFCNNTAQSPVTNLAIREVLLNLLTCHIATLALRGDQVGAVASAGEGSVNVSFSLPTNPNAAYFAQTQCGYTYWQMSLPYRGFRYFGTRKKVR